MSDNTFTYDGVELNAEDTLRAIELVTNENDETAGNTAIVGNVVIIGDTYDDPDATVTTLDSVEEVANGNVYDISGERTFTNVTSLRERAEEAQRTDFTEYVEGISEIGSSNDINPASEVEVALGSADVSISYDSHLSSGEMRALEDDDGVRLSKSRAGGDILYIGVEDVRDE